MNKKINTNNVVHIISFITPRIQLIKTKVLKKGKTRFRNKKIESYNNFINLIFVNTKFGQLIRKNTYYISKARNIINSKSQFKIIEKLNYDSILHMLNLVVEDNKIPHVFKILNNPEGIDALISFNPELFMDLLIGIINFGNTNIFFHIIKNYEFTTTPEIIRKLDMSNIDSQHSYNVLDLIIQKSGLSPEDFFRNQYVYIFSKCNKFSDILHYLINNDLIDKDAINHLHLIKYNSKNKRFQNTSYRHFLFKKIEEYVSENDTITALKLIKELKRIYI